MSTPITTAPHKHWVDAECVDADHPRRTEVERFIRTVYRQRFGASLTELMPHLLAFRGRDGALAAAIGLRCGSEGTMFCERYLDQRAELQLAQRLGQPVARTSVVELGNFAATTAGAGRAVVLALIPLLQQCDMRWVLMVATRQLRNSFDRLGLSPQHLVAADPQRLGSEAASWGSYYAQQPALMFGDLRAATVVAQGSVRATPEALAPQHCACMGAA